jgi:hypothetical protein
LSYTLVDSTSGTDQALDASVFTFSGTALTINTVDNLKIKLYTLKATATQNTYTVTNTITFKVNIIDSCNSVVITKTPLTSPQ